MKGRYKVCAFWKEFEVYYSLCYTHLDMGLDRNPHRIAIDYTILDVLEENKVMTKKGNLEERMDYGKERNARKRA